MENALLLDIVNYLISKGLATADGEDIFRDFIPEAPDNIVVLYEYAGDSALYYESSVNRSIQISVRDVSADNARMKALDIYKALLSDTARVDFTDTRWGMVYLRQPPFKIDIDKQNRVTYGFNVGITTTIN
jgi:hypothetical protein